VPALHVKLGKYQTLLKVVSACPLANGKYVPQACDFVDKIISGCALSTKKPLRGTERHWRKLGVNVRST
jgi:hypothetical protein